jgi:signal transduction histidine kinase
MKLRTKLILLQCSIFVVLSAIVVAILLSLYNKTLPLMEQGVRTKVRACVQTLLTVVDVGIAAGDRAAVKRAFALCPHGGGTEDPPLIEVLDASGGLVASYGRIPPGLRPAALPDRRTIGRYDGGFRDVAPVLFEGVRLGTLVVGYSTASIHRWKRWALGFSVVGLALFFGSCLASILFAVHLIKPLRKMIHFVHNLARGRLKDHLEVRASDELGDLAQDLNAMTAKLDESRQQLSDASRRSGMAEIATHMLHNVGNVLNSVNVAATLSTSKVREMRVDNVAQLADLLESQPDLAAFFTADARGQKLPVFLRLLAGHLVAEREAALGELQRLQRSVDHIKTIVATQQEYARCTGVLEPVQLADVLDTALGLNLESNRRESITVERDYGALPDIVTDRHKVLQILINLLSNSRGALREAPGTDKRISVRAKQVNGIARISVTDNGIGIPEEILPRIFEHGFTTKQDGHGFGLHSSANAARELGGTLTCTSAGKGRGATFTLRIPMMTRIEPEKETSDGC